MLVKHLTPLLLALLLITSATHADVLRFAAEDDWLPYTGQDKGQPVGLTLDLIRAAYKAVGVDTKFESMSYSRCMAAARTAHYAGCFNTAQGHRYQTDYLYAQTPLIRGRIFIYGHRPEHGLTLQSLLGQQVATVISYSYGDDFDQNPQIQQDVANNEWQSFRKVAAGRIAYTVAWEGTARQLFKRYPELRSRVHHVGELPPGAVYISFSRQYPHIEHYISQFERGMALIRQSGELDTIERRWLGPDHAPAN